MKHWQLLLISLVTVQLAACGQIQTREVHDAKGIAYLPGKADIRSALLVADNQFNFYFTDPIVLRNRAADYISHVAIRPPQLDLFADDLFGWTLSKHASGKYVIHLGDATNIACVSEWERFTQVMRKSQAPSGMKGWVMAPGNHDAYLYGVTGGGESEVPFNNVGLQWAKACSQKWPIENDNDVKLEWRLTKNALLDAYIKQIKEQQNYHPEDFSFDEMPESPLPSKYQHLCDGNEANCTMKVLNAKTDNAFVQKIIYVKYPSTKTTEKSFDYGDQHKSFMVQLLNISQNTTGQKTYAILIDTVDYSQIPSNIRGFICGIFFNSSCGINAGTTGMISILQQKLVEDLITAVEGKGAYYVLMGHHPIGQKGDHPLEKDSSEWLLAKTSRKLSLGYISAHTHFGYVQERNHNDEHEVSIENHQEINIGSATDWPIEIRTLESTVSEGVTEGNIMSRLIRIGGADLPQAEECSALHHYSSTKNHDYVSYHHGNWQPNTAQIEHEKTLDTLLVTYIRLYRDLKVTPSATPIQALVAEAEKYILKRCANGYERESGDKDSKSCRETKRDLAMCMWRVDKWLQGETQELEPLGDQDACPKKTETLMPIANYAEKRHNYGVCQAVWASQAEFIFTHNELNALKSLSE